LNAKHTLHHCPVIASVVCRPDGGLPDGTALEAAFARLRDAGADVVGVNCTAFTPALLAALPAPDEDLPLAVFPSAGLPVDRGGRLEYPVAPAQFGRDLVALARAGARLLGGCCGASPAHISAMTAALAEAGLISSS
jgi:homocysteine S-methyltransferase